MVKKPRRDGCRFALDIFGNSPVDLYDSVSRCWVAKGVTGETSVQLAADSAVVLVLCPSGKPITRQGKQLLCDGVVVDYTAGP